MLLLAGYEKPPLLLLLGVAGVLPAGALQAGALERCWLCAAW
jgi:hypothetical protein